MADLTYPDHNFAASTAAVLARHEERLDGHDQADERLTDMGTRIEGKLDRMQWFLITTLVGAVGSLLATIIALLVKH